MSAEHTGAEMGALEAQQRADPLDRGVRPRPASIYARPGMVARASSYPERGGILVILHL